MGMFWITEQCPPGKFSILLIWIRHCASSTDGEMKISREMQSHSRLGGSDAHDFVPTIPGCLCLGPRLVLVGGYYSLFCILGRSSV